LKTTIKCFVAPWETKFICDILDKHHLTETLIAAPENDDQATGEKFAINSAGDGMRSDTLRNTVDDSEGVGHEGRRSQRYLKNEEAINLIFKFLMVLTSLQFCIANGATGAANSISPLLNV
jgi:phosphate/sulfate permease